MTRLGVFTPEGFIEARFSVGAFEALVSGDLPVSYREVTQINELPEKAKSIVGRWESDTANGHVYTDGDNEEEPTHLHIIRYL